VKNELHTISIGQTTHNQSNNLVCSAVCSIYLACGAVCCTVLLYVAVRCSVLQCNMHVCTFFVYLIGVNTRVSVYGTHVHIIGVCPTHVYIKMCVSDVYICSHSVE